MKEYTVKKIDHAFSWNDISAADIATVNWHHPENHPEYDPKASAKLVHDDQNILMQLTAEEDFIRSEVFTFNGAVCDDSCLEVFIAPPAKPDTYFNLEINPAGVVYLGVGQIRENRTKIDPEIIKKYITVMAETFEDDPEKRGKWQLTVIMNKDIFPAIMDVPFCSGEGTGNFYKCGCRVTRHYLSWNPVGTEHPDFHTPAFFGKVVFE